MLPTLGYALSQRNNHAISEAGFLWTAAVLLPWLPDAEGCGDRAAAALTEATADQFAADGSYAQHSPTYQRVALHMLLWCLLVERADRRGRTGPASRRLSPAACPSSARSSLRAARGACPTSGATTAPSCSTVAGADLGDLRPVIVHAAAATGQTGGFGPGPWDDEAAGGSV